MSRHTEGPWKINQTPYGTYYIGAGPEDPVTGASRQCIVSSGWSGPNLHLIAAAPIMYEVLQEVMPLLEDWHEDDHRASPVWRRAKAALAQVEGNA